MAETLPARVERREIQLSPETGVVLGTLSQALEFSEMICRGGFAPKGGTPQSVATAVIFGQTLGLNPMASVQNICVINGKPSIYGDAVMALLLARNVLESFSETTEGEGDARTATCRAQRKGFPDEFVRTFSVADAKRAGLWGKSGPWTTYPDRMLAMRARGFCVRDGFADILGGLITSDEAYDYPAPPQRGRPRKVEQSTATVVAPQPPQPPQPEQPRKAKKVAKKVAKRTVADEGDHEGNHDWLQTCRDSHVELKRLGGYPNEVLREKKDPAEMTLAELSLLADEYQAEIEIQRIKNATVSAAS